MFPFDDLRPDIMGGGVAMLDLSLRSPLCRRAGLKSTPLGRVAAQEFDNDGDTSKGCSL